MELTNLPKTTQKSKKRIGRGHGSGRGGHTSTRGTKGQRSRSKIGLFFEGTKFKKSLLKRLPLSRGKGKLKSRQDRALVINLKYLGLFKAGDEVSLETLKIKGIIADDLSADTKVKILGEGEISVPLKVCLPVSKGAAEKIRKAGGTIETVTKKIGETEEKETVKAPEKEALQTEKSKPKKTVKKEIKLKTTAK